MDEIKKQVGYLSADYIKDGMTVGLGTGSTAYYMVEALGKKVQAGELDITGVTTSHRTAEQAQSYGIPLKSVDEVEKIDITIDGADEICSDYHGIKGGGGALLFEKVVATYSDEVIWIVDESKMVEDLGGFPLPVEVVVYGHDQILRAFEEKGYNPTLRMDGSAPYETDNQNYIIDLRLEKIKDPQALAKELNNMVGVVEHGLFLDIVDRIIVGSPEGVETIEV